MYNQFYGFREKPFSLLPDPDFLYVSQEHGTGLNLLELAILNQSGFCVISGEIGAGKTTIIREVLNRLDEQVRVGLITNTHASFNDLLRWILAAFELEVESDEGVVMHRQFTDFVTEQFRNGRHTLLIIDEAQNLSVAALEQLRMLSNINSGSELLLQVILVGQRELRENLKRPELEQFAQRIAIDYFLAPLNESETTAYIEHRVAHAGGKNPLFDTEACARIYRYSRGIPRVINRLCDLSLVYGYAENVQTIGANLVEAVVTKQKLDKPGKKANRKKTQAVKNAEVEKKPALMEPVVSTEQSGRVHQKEEPKLSETKTALKTAEKQPNTNVDAGGRAMNRTSKSADAEELSGRGGADVARSADTQTVSAEEAVKRHEQLERVAAEKAQHAKAAVETAAANLADSRQAETEMLAAERRLEEAVSVGENTSQLAAAAKSAAETTVAERKAAEAVELEKKKNAALADEKAKLEKAAAAEQIAQIAGIEKEARMAAEKTIAAAETALAERVAAEKAAAEAAAAATDLVNEATEERIAVETETSSRLAEVEKAAALAAAEQSRASQMVVDKVNSEKAARAQAEACARVAEEKAAERVQATQLAEEKINAAEQTREIAEAGRKAAEAAVVQRAEAERAAIASATVEKVAMASVAADEAAEASRLAEIADAAQQAALREAGEAKAAAAAAARRAAEARAAAETAAAVESKGTNEAREVRSVPRPLTDEPAMKELLLSSTPEIIPEVEARGRNNAGRTWAVMAITAVVAGAAWFVTQSGDSGNNAGPGELAGRTGIQHKHSAGVAVDTAAMEISGEIRKPDK